MTVAQIPAHDGYIHYDLWIHGFLNATVPSTSSQAVPAPLPTENRFGEVPKSGDPSPTSMYCAATEILLVLNLPQCP